MTFNGRPYGQRKTKNSIPLKKHVFDIQNFFRMLVSCQMILKLSFIPQIPYVRLGSFTLWHSTWRKSRTLHLQLKVTRAVDRCRFGVPSRSTIELPLLQAGLGTAYVKVLVVDDHTEKATLHKDILYMAGQLGLDPPTMLLSSGGPTSELVQALENSEAVAKCFGCSISTSAVLFIVYCSISVNELDSSGPAKKTENDLIDCAGAAVPLCNTYGWGFRHESWHYECIQKYIVPGRLCAAILSIKENNAAKICSTLQQGHNDAENENFLEEQMERTAKFGFYLLDEVLSEHQFN
ncbi:hypothetical protein M9H77_28775 [Catharanthus roseus]|uniref:Uncharacterized protein n=1 Tax=Catharanthus roseus TaxID=4058 RepID=A0ACC0AGB0_CATRO|nr:hypothetical protein M9H77_28775 [Catharanthus roseus]